ncbi:MAG: DNA methyltransferase [Candidatus Edwardsbacteria bacterium RIFOXYD12_FULL_50_11]|uniref:DNA methyltransferase n=1 Tax=Candidatus Edwardsbacteria bacterium GWF2_54_11 TaxID=1817851 RepID=A0A1F5RBZ3_9BACT|nr:MAG: DNA methyltransferase [Candidatus Edwardsbacteria bacterium RifOxyC12_full_54_24]OGF07442.1 MAG: DNA methyltransferase [Candidatus Edwardsbacteria bacterium RifOxyA12_full_54_48]OGF09692.1 MAG: DNA methyltransferase [Candidatus Edwardsbacteria bacterium GWE2_54_12]OGF11955.1 MAG: DNA methyltransferase [Candidatus Edwardsbacteria bacterium GWF2_54_11]OGF18137.1 MAG: DNA methyltransferase [Candidatus Edwardsbacteria bacterium RIFOXYD12_FULL_50_11]OGJ19619.1 MAG: DNA methyltransferase [Ca
MTFSSNIISVIKRIPHGKVASYGQIAALAGNPRGARAVIWILHSSSGKEKLPWHRVINGKGQISLKPSQGYEEQRVMLESEGVEFSLAGTIDLDIYRWKNEDH